MHRSQTLLARAALGDLWYIREAALPLLSGELPDELLARAGTVSAPRATGGAVGVVPFRGLIVPHPSIFASLFGGSSIEELRAGMQEALGNRDVVAVIGDFSSPGGSVEGVEEFATWIREQRGTKPMVAVANGAATSAAYYLAAQFDEIVASPSSITGSIGVYTDHVEESAANEAAGIKPTRIRAPATKGEINDAEPLTDEARAHLQSLVDDYYEQFVNAVAKGRGVTAGEVRGGYGQGRELTAGRAKAAGLVDRIDTLDNTIRRLASGRGRAAMTAAPAAVPTNGPALRRSLDVVEAAFRGGYVLPSSGGDQGNA